MKLRNIGLYRVLALILTLSIGLMLPVSAYCQVESPPPPKEPSSDLRMPEAVKHQDKKGNASVPEDSKLAFALDLSGIIKTGDWHIEGKVSSTENSAISFVTDKDETGHFVYRLPKDFRLTIEEKDWISIDRTMAGYGASLGYKLSVSGKDSLELASGKLYGNNPQQVKLSKDIILKQDTAFGKVVSESKYETIYHVPVAIMYDRKILQLDPNKTIGVEIHGIKYNLLITRSFLGIPSKGYEGVVEGSGYSLEYILVSE